jgi:hypothetical protein
VYADLLFAKFEAEEEEARRREAARMEEGMKLLERKSTERRLADAALLADHHSRAAALTEGSAAELKRVGSSRSGMGGAGRP